MLGLLGLNGVGKMIILRMILIVLKLDEGSIIIFGYDIVKKLLVGCKLIGFLFGSIGLYGCLMVKENIEYFVCLYGMSKKVVVVCCDELFILFDMYNFIDKCVENFFMGMK